MLCASDFRFSDFLDIGQGGTEDADCDTARVPKEVGGKGEETKGGRFEVHPLVSCQPPTRVKATHEVAVVVFLLSTSGLNCN